MRLTLLCYLNGNSFGLIRLLSKIWLTYVIKFPGALSWESFFVWICECAIISLLYSPLAQYNITVALFWWLINKLRIPKLFAVNTEVSTFSFTQSACYFIALIGRCFSKHPKAAMYRKDTIAIPHFETLLSTLYREDTFARVWIFAAPLY